MITLQAAAELLDFGTRIGRGSRADEQLRGAVALHNILCKQGVAYLADEVGMGKTYVALGALALFRHFDPNFRVLIIAPRENIQSKWQKELSNFAANNVRFSDLRVRAIDGRPAKALVSCRDLIELVREVSLDPNRDFFTRMTSFSLMMGKSADDWKHKRKELQQCLPWLADDALDLRSKDQFKRNFARAVCCALPQFDLVIVDEAHNLKHGLQSSSARNQVLAESFGHSPDGESPSSKLFPGYGPRARRVLFLSATPLEETYRHLFNQLDLFGVADGFDDLKADVPEARKKAVAAQFLVRRVTSIKIAEVEHTKNMYRREWRAGGVLTHDNPIRIEDERQRLIVALVQKKVSELLGGKNFKRSFQIGMLASFESFLETTRLKRDSAEESTFDDADQTDVVTERDGLDVRDLNRLARDYHKTFGHEMPHPKMDALVAGLASTWQTGKKALVFVRRVASVKELKRKLDERYDAWLIDSLRTRLPGAMQPEFEKLVERYKREKHQAADTPGSGPEDRSAEKEGKLDDAGGNDTFFAWFFRGDGRKGYVSGATIQARFTAASSAYATFFEDNHVMALLGARPGTVLTALAAALGISPADAATQLQKCAALYLSRAETEKNSRGPRMEAAQASAMELLSTGAQGTIRQRAEIIWQDRYRASQLTEHAKAAPPEIVNALEESTFFTELRRPEHAALRALIWPEGEPARDADGYRQQFREEILRAQLLSTAARLGHASIDLYVCAMAGRSTLVGRGAEEGGTADQLLEKYFELLEAQRAVSSHAWGALAELRDMATHFDLIIDVNAPELKTAPLQEAARLIASLLRRQQPVGGMAGQVNKSLVRQFRMPGYPLVLVTTDVLQEGEDLHTFCSAIHHYGISWTPSAMEQRIGRIDRVRSQTDRRLTALNTDPQGEDWLQVYYPYLSDTVEVLQVDRVLDGMNKFLRLMHEELTTATQEQSMVDVAREILRVRKPVEKIRSTLKSSFPVPDWALAGTQTTLAVSPGIEKGLRSRFAELSRQPKLGSIDIEWAKDGGMDRLVGTARLSNQRMQPFALLLRSDQGLPVIRCVSPIGRTDPESDPGGIASRAPRIPSRVGAILTKEERTYDLTVEDDVVLGAPEHDLTRTGLLIRRVVEHADFMEREHFKDGRDAALLAFEDDLRREGGDEG